MERLASEGCGRLPSQQEGPAPGEAPRIQEAPSGPTRAPAPSPSPTRSARPAPRVIGVVSSTGGPQTLLRALRPLPRSFPCAVVLVQHMSDGFDQSFRDMLAAHLQLEVRLAEDGDPLVAGQLLVAAPGAHMVTAGDRVRLDARSPAEANHKPSGNKLLHSLAISHGKSAWGIVLTGMGDDGAAGLLAMRRAGCHTIAQDAASAILDGMPKRARELGAAEVVLGDLEIGPYLLQQVPGRS